MHIIPSAGKVKKHLEQRTREIGRKICLLGIYLQVDHKFRKTEEKFYKKVKSRLEHELILIVLKKGSVKTDE
ncbi:MAG: hypothetical protein ACOCSJ_01825 [Candidatus Natronoplasma sp.]